MRFVRSLFRLFEPVNAVGVWPCMQAHRRANPLQRRIEEAIRFGKRKTTVFRNNGVFDSKFMEAEKG
jgi:hypothetical protein